MTPKDKVWIKFMDFFNKYWGCHQLPQRSFFFHGYQFPICARCTGIICGYLLAIITQFFIFIPIHYLAIICIPMIIDGLIQQKTRYTSNNHKRFVTGILFGYGFLGIFIQVFKLIL